MRAGWRSPASILAWLVVASSSLLPTTVAGAGCAAAGRKPEAATEPVLTPADVAPLLPSSVKGTKERAGWSADIVAALTAWEIAPTPTNVCAVVAIVEQESGFRADPVVPSLGKIVRARLDAIASHLGPLSGPALSAVLDEKGPGQRHTFLARFTNARTESEVDRTFRDVLRFYEARYPTAMKAADLFGGLFADASFEDLNPITTAGSMQVSVRYAVEQGRERGLTPEEVREALYTRAGGLLYGTGRLLVYEAAYDDPIYRFADYNAGPYASRNAAFQAQLERLVGTKLAKDGDLLAYDQGGAPKDVDSQSLLATLGFRLRHAPKLSESRVRRDLRQEKGPAFEKTDTWRAVKRVFQEVTGDAPRYAQVPDVAIASPKLSKPRTTAWFADNVKRRYEACLARARRPGA